MSKTLTFFGSGPVAARSLELLAVHFEIEAVITKPQPPHHKEIFPVLAVAQKLGLKVLETADKNALEQLFLQKPVSSDIGVVIDYGILIPQSVIDQFSLGIVNSHFSLLPRWRGADPISFAILEGDQETGVSLMLIVAQLDEGPLLGQRSLHIAPDATTPSLTNELISLSDQLLTEMLPLYIDGQLQPQPQSGNASYSLKLSKSDGLLDWHKPAAMLERQVRAYAEWPRSRTQIAGIDAVVTRAHVAGGVGEPGTIWRSEKEFGFYTAEGVLVIDRLIPSGKKEMTAEAFLAGHKI